MHFLKAHHHLARVGMGGWRKRDSELNNTDVPHLYFALYSMTSDQIMPTMLTFNYLIDHTGSHQAFVIHFRIYSADTRIPYVTVVTAACLWLWHYYRHISWHLYVTAVFPLTCMYISWHTCVYLTLTCQIKDCDLYISSSCRHQSPLSLYMTSPIPSLSLHDARLSYNMNNFTYVYLHGCSL